MKKTEGDFEFTVENSKASITAYSGSCYTHIIIPKTLGGYGVTHIGDEVFHLFANLIHVEIPNSVTRIGVEAFFWGDRLAKLEIPDSVKHIGERAFAYSGLMTIEIPNASKC